MRHNYSKTGAHRQGRAGLHAALAMTCYLAVSGILIRLADPAAENLSRFWGWDRAAVAQLLSLGAAAAAYLIPVVVFGLPLAGSVPGRKMPVWAVPAFLLACICASALCSRLDRLLGIPAGNDPFKGGGFPLLLLVQTCLFAPLLEEVFYRGLIQRLLAPLGRLCAIMGSTVLFGLMHPLGGNMLYALFAGALLGICAERTGRLLPCILLHAAANGLNFLLLYLQQSGLLVF